MVITSAKSWGQKKANVNLPLSTECKAVDKTKLPKKTKVATKGKICQPVKDPLAKNRKRKSKIKERINKNQKLLTPKVPPVRKSKTRPAKKVVTKISLALLETTRWQASKKPNWSARPYFAKMQRKPKPRKNNRF